MKTKQLAPRWRQRGFTLVEAIVVMVVTGILAGIMVLFIRQPVQNYVDAAGRADMSDVADLALRRITRELHGALPNSMRVTTIGSATLLEFIPTKAGGVYLAAEDDAGTPVLDFVNANLSFKVVSDWPAAPYNIVANPANPDYVVVYNLGPGYAGADAYASAPSARNRSQVSGVDSVNQIISMQDNPFAVGAAGVPNASPTHRFNIVKQPVTFSCAPNAVTGVPELRRYWNYGFQAAQIDPATLANSNALLASYVSNCSFSYGNTINLQHGLISLSLSVGRANSTELVQLAQQVNVENTP